MPAYLILSLSFILLCAGLIASSVYILINVKYKPGVATKIKIPIIGEIETDVPAICFLLFSALCGYFAHDLGRESKNSTIDFKGKIKVEESALADISAIVVGITTSPWTMTGTPDRDQGILELTFPVPDNWNNYTAYAFAHGHSNVRPSVIGLKRDQKDFQLDLRQ
jgi:hypothetical protein